MMSSSSMNHTTSKKQTRKERGRSSAGEKFIRLRLLLNEAQLLLALPEPLSPTVRVRLTRLLEACVGIVSTGRARIDLKSVTIHPQDMSLLIQKQDEQNFMSMSVQDATLNSRTGCALTSCVGISSTALGASCRNSQCLYTILSRLTKQKR